MICPKCGSEFKEITLTPESIHYAKETCSICGHFFKWIINPEKEGQRISTSKFEISDILKFHNYNEEFCFFCLRNKKQLGDKETLTRDHIIELDKGGKDELQNIQILCISCHKLKNWARLYMNWHFNKEQ